jgi:putative ABC transport system ATP-binding protein
MRNGKLIDVRHAVKTYQMGDEKFYAMNDISFSIEEGEFVAIMGASGSGKSTCMNMLERLINRQAVNTTLTVLMFSLLTLMTFLT